MSNIQNAIVNFGYAIQGTIDTGINNIEDKFSNLRYETQISKTEVLATIQLIFADILTVITENDAHKLFYLKSKLEALTGDGRTLTNSEFNYKNILQKELNKIK